MKVFECIAYVHVLDELRTKLDPKAEKCIFVGYSLEQKGYRYYNNLDTREIFVSKDVVFDGTSICMDIDGENDEVVVKASPQKSRELSKLVKSSQTSTKLSPWLSRLRAKDGSPNVLFGSFESRTKSTKGKKKVNQSMADFDVSAAGHLSDDESLDEEFRIPKVKTLGVQRMEGETSLRRSTHVKYPVERLKYDILAAHHYVYMVKVVQVQEPTCFEDAVGTLEWDQAMDEEMAALDENETWDLVPLPGSKNVIGCKWV